jgi:PAS domain S-box-containing protein
MSGEVCLAGSPGGAWTAGDVGDAIRRLALPCAVIDPAANRLVRANAAFAALLHLEPGRVEGFEFLPLFPPGSRVVVESVMSGMAAGLLQSCQGRALLELPDGRSLEVSGWVRLLNGSPESRAVLAVVPGVPVPAAGSPPLPPMMGPMAAPDAARLTLGTVDHDWRFAEISPDAAEWLGWSPEEYRGTPLQSVVHPDDAPLLLLALGRSSVERRGVATGLRVRCSDGSWTPVCCEVSPLCRHNPPRFAIAMWSLDLRPDEESSDQRAARLEDHLWRIALEVAAAGIGDAPATTEMWWGDPALRELSQRQLEILRRLLRGERVPTIARDLYLSQSTVRNHLSAIYRRLGVHSQAELLARLLPARQASPDDEI